MYDDINKPDLSFDFKDLFIHEDSLNISLSNLKGSAFNFPVNGKVIFNKNTSIIQGELELVEFTIPEHLFDKIPMKNKMRSLNIASSVAIVLAENLHCNNVVVETRKSITVLKKFSVAIVMH